MKTNQKLYSDSPQFKYARTTLVILNSSKDDREIRNFYENLIERSTWFNYLSLFLSHFRPDPVRERYGSYRIR